MKHALNELNGVKQTQREREQTDQPFTVHLCTEIDLEVLCIVKDVEEGTALVKLGDAEEKQSTVIWTIIPQEQIRLRE